MDTRIDDSWYAPDDTTILRYVKQITLTQEQHREDIKQLSDDIKLLLNQQQQQINDVKELLSVQKDEIRLLQQKYTKLEERQKDINIKKINDALHELHVIREREINALLREHIPFQFVSPFPKLKRPFSFLPKK